MLTNLLFIDCSKMARIRINTRTHTKEKSYLMNSYFFFKLVRQKKSIRWAKYVYVCEWDMCRRNSCNFPWWIKNVKSRSKIALFSKERHFEIWFQKKRTITFFWSKISKLHKEDPILHVATTFSLKQGETRTSHGPIPHPLKKKSHHGYLMAYQIVAIQWLHIDCANSQKSNMLWYIWVLDGASFGTWWRIEYDCILVGDDDDDDNNNNNNNKRRRVFALSKSIFSRNRSLMDAMWFYGKERIIGKGNLYLTENWLSWNEMCCAADNYNYMYHKCAKEFLDSKLN